MITNTKLLAQMNEVAFIMLERMEREVKIGIINVRITNTIGKEGSDEQTITHYDTELLERANGDWNIEETVKNEITG